MLNMQSLAGHKNYRQNEAAGRIWGRTAAFCAILMLFALLMGPALAGTETGEFCPTCPDWSDIDGWLAKKAAYEQEQQKIAQPQGQETQLKVQNLDPAPVQAGSNSSPTNESSNSAPSNESSKSSPGNESPLRSGSFARALVSPAQVLPDDMVLDISPSATRFIKGSVNLNYEQFLGHGGKLKAVPEIAALLGKAGISSNDSLVITGECLPCGGGPSPAAFTYWLLRYLGHEKVRILDASTEDWEAAGLNTSVEPAIRPETNYTPSLRPELLATYDFVANGGAQIVDARPASDFSTGSIPSAINIPYSEVMEKDRVKSEEDIRKTFARLKGDKPVVVYTNVGVEASLVWLALTLSGYDARLYSLSDWLDNQPAFSYELADVEAKPNPVRSGTSTTIAATFQERQTKAAEKPSPEGEVRLTVMQCAGCGFTSQDIFANLNRTGGFVQVGYAGKASGAATGGSLSCTAVINGPNDQEAARMSLLRTSANKYMGIWNADVAPGVYRLSILASISGSSTTFPDVLEIEVTD